MSRSGSAQDRPRRRPTSDDEPVLPDVTREERSPGWGRDAEETDRDAEWYERERPPHHE